MSPRFWLSFLIWMAHFWILVFSLLLNNSYCFVLFYYGMGQILIIIFWVLLERATRGVMNEFLAKYGKELDKEKQENKRLGMTQKESAVLMVNDYQLPLTPDQFIKEITPLYRQR